MLVFITIAVVIITSIYWFFVRSSDDNDDDDLDWENMDDTQEGANADAWDDPDDSRPRMSIFYGTQTGTAEDFASTMAAEAIKYGFRARAVDLIDVDDPQETLSEETLAVFLVATYGEGEPTDNARDFYEWLTEDSVAAAQESGDDEPLLGNLKFCVFGLGNTQYKIYQHMARTVDRRLEELGAKRVFERGEGDADDNIEEDFEEWMSKCIADLSAQFGTEMVAEDKIEKKYEMKFHENARDPELPFARPRGIPDAKMPFFSPVLVNKQLLNITDADSNRSTVHIEFDISGSRISYEAGDHLAVYAQNPANMVKRLVTRLGISEETLDKCFSLTKRDNGTPYFNKRTTVRSALTHLVDLHAPARKQAIRVLAEYAQDEAEKEKLLLLASNTTEGKEYYAQYVRAACRDMVDLLEEFPSVDVPLDHFLEVMPRMQPRYYSIASSPLLHPKSIHVVVSVVRYKSPAEERDREGLCSSFLEQLKVGDGAYIFVRHSSFHLPTDLSRPVVMVGPGTGIAPFVGFMQQRQALMEQKNATLGNGYLFFGCRRSTEDYIYKELQEESVKLGALSGQFVAFSREQEHKVYVQHKIRENKELIYDALVKQKGYLYVCGDAKYMAKDVDQTLMDILVEYSNGSQEEAQKIMDELSSSKRYLSDVWSSV